MFNTLLDDYWNAAHAEGAEGRDHDTVNRAAHKALYAIHVEVAKMVEEAHMAGQADAGVDPGYSNARAYRLNLSGI